MPDGYKVADQINGFLRGLSRDGKSPFDRAYSSFIDNSGRKLTFQEPTIKGIFDGIVIGIKEFADTINPKRAPDANDVIRANNTSAPPSGPGINYLEYAKAGQNMFERMRATLNAGRAE